MSVYHQRIDETLFFISIVFIAQSKGLDTDPWGTPVFESTSFDFSYFIETDCWLVSLLLIGLTSMRNYALKKWLHFAASHGVWERFFVTFPEKSSFCNIRTFVCCFAFVWYIRSNIVISEKWGRCFHKGKS